MMAFATGYNSKSNRDFDPAAMPADKVPEDFSGIGIKEKLGQSIDLNLLVKNEAGESVPLKNYFKAHHPVILSLVYFSCPGLCNFHLNGLVDGLKEMKLKVGSEFDVIALSFDSREKPETAAAKKVNYLKVLGQENAGIGFHFLTADESTVKALTSSVGFEYKWNEKAGEWAHASAAVFLTPEGKISRYLHGIIFKGDDLKLALGEASDGKIGNIVDSIIWRCFKWDPTRSQYVFYSHAAMQIGGGIIIVFLFVLLIPFWIRSRRNS